MRPTIVLALLLLVVPVARVARGAPDRRVEASEVRGGFSKKLAADTVPATLPRATPTKSLFSGVKVTAEVGAD